MHNDNYTCTYTISIVLYSHQTISSSVFSCLVSYAAAMSIKPQTFIGSDDTKLYVYTTVAIDIKTFVHIRYLHNALKMLRVATKRKLQ